jgi:hypothetical protein
MFKVMQTGVRDFMVIDREKTIAKLQKQQPGRAGLSKQEAKDLYKNALRNLRSLPRHSSHIGAIFAVRRMAHKLNATLQNLGIDAAFPHINTQTWNRLELCN